MKSLTIIGNDDIRSAIIIPVCSGSVSILHRFRDIIRLQPLNTAYVSIIAYELKNFILH